MLRNFSFKGPRGLFLCLVLATSALPHVGHVYADPVPPELGLRPPSVAVHQVELVGAAVEYDKTVRPWSRRVTPVAIHYPGIDSASAAFQEKAAATPHAFNQWLADKWMEKNAMCNNIFQTDPRNFGYFQRSDQQCTELNRPIKDLVPSCESPVVRPPEQGLVKVQWQCKLEASTQPEVYTETIVHDASSATPLVNPASKELTLNHQNGNAPSK